MVHYRLSSDLPRHLLKETYHNAQYYWTNEKILLTFLHKIPIFIYHWHLTTPLRVIPVRITKRGLIHL